MNTLTKQTETDAKKILKRVASLLTDGRLTELRTILEDNPEIEKLEDLTTASQVRDFYHCHNWSTVEAARIVLAWDMIALEEMEGIEFTPEAYKQLFDNCPPGGEARRIVALRIQYMLSK